jgi:lipoprotein-releasing system permease protein
VYKVLLCWRYLKTRYLALACIVSVMLGVAILIVVNSVMSGFSTKLRSRLHSLLSDVVVESTSLDGFLDPQGKMDRIRNDPYLADKIGAMAATMDTWAMLQYRFPNGELCTRTVKLIGIEPESRAAIGGFKNFLVFQKDKEHISLQVPPEAAQRYQRHLDAMIQPELGSKLFPVDPDEPPPPAPVPQDMKTFKVPRGAVVGKLIATFQREDPENPGHRKEFTLLRQGDPITLMTVSGAVIKPAYDTFLVVDYFSSEMSEYDANCVFVPLDYLQHLRTMEDRVTSIQISLKNYDRDARHVVERLKTLFPDASMLHVATWEDKQGALLAAISIEKGILNVLLFMIVGVAGFGILSIFTMIVAEKTKDIGILKALGASSGGVMKIFLAYGLLLGVIGAGLGSGLGIWLTDNINGVEQALSAITGQEVFNRSVYYFDKIPTDIQIWNVVAVNLGAVVVAVLFSALPALRAAMLHPVRALRYE